MKAGVRPGDTHDLSPPCDRLDRLAAGGREVFGWVYDAVKPDVWLVSMSGGTDVAAHSSVAARRCRSTPASSRPSLGARVEALDEGPLDRRRPVSSS